ncbi:hypothetical protein A2U01_0043398, partial [Trifolium medium]|nr:hypothetical protein [Trifolium medium]
MARRAGYDGALRQSEKRKALELRLIARRAGEAGASRQSVRRDASGRICHGRVAQLH